MACAVFDPAQIAMRIASTVDQELNRDGGESMSARRSTPRWFASVFFGALMASTAASAQARYRSDSVYHFEQTVESSRTTRLLAEK